MATQVRRRGKGGKECRKGGEAKAMHGSGQGVDGKTPCPKGQVSDPGGGKAEPKGPGAGGEEGGRGGGAVGVASPAAASVRSDEVTYREIPPTRCRHQAAIHARQSGRIAQGSAPGGGGGDDGAERLRGGEGVEGEELWECLPTTRDGDRKSPPARERATTWSRVDKSNSREGLHRGEGADGGGEPKAKGEPKASAE
jgi:hypothetical protein